MVYHTIEPYYNRDSEILILGSMPSVKSRELGFYYAHPQNRFWKVLSSIYHEDDLKDVDDKKDFLKRHKIALYDVCASCDIKGSSDSSIKNVQINDIGTILTNTRIKQIFVNGKTAYHLYNLYLKDTLHKEAICLPSTSPANAHFCFHDLVSAYKVLTKY